MTLRAIEKSQTLLINEQSRQMESGGREVFKFGFGQSPFPVLPQAAAALAAAAHRKEYAPVQGMPELRERVAAFHREAEGIDIDAARVLIAPGSKILIYTAMASFVKADVLIPAPAWVSYLPQTKLLGHHAVQIATDFERRWRVTPEAVERAVQAKPDKNTPSILILNTPGNPDGLGYTEAELLALAEIFRRHSILVISDEIYGLLHHRGEHLPLAKFYAEGTITTGGLSKWCGAGGWRLGVAMLPRRLDGEFKDVMLGIGSETYSCAPTPIQLAACEAYQWNEILRDYLTHQRRLLELLGNRTAEKLRAAGVRVHPPEGGFYLFPDFSEHAAALAARGITDSQGLCAALLAGTGVALLPGSAFGIAPGQLCARLAYVEFDGAAAMARSREWGLARPLDESFLPLVFSKAMRGIEAICAWL